MNKMKSLLALLLVAALALGLAGCGTKDSAVKSDEPQPTETPDYVYAATYKKVNAPDGLSYLSTGIFTGDGYYASSSVKIGEEIPEGAELEYEGQYDVYENRLFFVGLDGSLRALEGYTPLETAQNTGNYPSFYAGTGTMGMAVNAEGQLVLIEDSYVSYFDGTEAMMASDNSYQNWVYRDQYYLRVLDTDGTELSCAPLDYDTVNTWLNFYGMKIDSQGNVLCCSDYELLAFAPDGSVVYSIDMPSYVNQLVKLGSGELAALIDGDDGPELAVLDLDKRAVSQQRYKLPPSCWSLSPGSGDYDAVYLSGQTLYGYRLDTQESERVLNMIDCDINGNYVSGLTGTGDGTMICLVADYSQEVTAYEIATLSLVPSSSLPQKSLLTMAVMDADYNYQLSEAVIKFNRSSDTCRITLLDYSQYNTEDDPSAGQTKLLTEVISGKLPDLLLLSNMPYKQLATKGFLEDLYPYIDADKELSRSDFFPTVLAAMEVDGKLCEVCSSFSISSLIGARSVVGDKPGWTYADFDAALASMPAGCEPLDMYTTRDDILRTLVSLEMDSLVDWSTGECRFDSEGFVEMLKFAARFPKSFDWDNYEWDSRDDEAVRLAEGRQMLQRASIYYISNLQYNRAYFNDDVTYIGYPTSSGVGSMLQLGAGDGALYAMSTACRDKQAAWSCLRGFLTEEGQKDAWGLPTNRNAFNKQLEEAMTPEYMHDANGNIVLDKEGQKVQVARGSYGRADGSIVNIYALTQEEADQLLELIDTTTKSESYDDAIFSIVSEQAQSFFAGQKSAEEVARLIQSKAKLYVNEQR